MAAAAQKYIDALAYHTEIRGQVGKEAVYQYNAVGKKFVVYAYPAYPPNTAPLQQRSKTIFAQGVAEWVALPEEEKRKYDQEAKKRRTSGIGLFLSKRLPELYQEGG